MTKSRELCAFIFSIVTLVAFTVAQDTGSAKDPTDSLVGDWRGNSVCQVRESACHDEDSLYHLARLPGKPGSFSMQGDKIVDGKPVTMGTVECSFDAKQNTLDCSLPRGVLHFVVDGNNMRGTMTLPDKTLWRKISLKKVGSLPLDRISNFVRTLREPE